MITSEWQKATRASCPLEIYFSDRLLLITPSGHTDLHRGVQQDRAEGLKSKFPLLFIITFL